MSGQLKQVIHSTVYIKLEPESQIDAMSSGVSWGHWTQDVSVPQIVLYLYLKLVQTEIAQPQLAGWTYQTFTVPDDSF